MGRTLAGQPGSGQDPRWLRRVAALYDSKRGDLNRRLAVDGLVHHHNGIAPPGRPAAAAPNDIQLLRRLHAMESAVTLEGLRRLRPGRGSLGLDAGCGRGGSSLLIARRAGCALVGVNVSSYQLRAARAYAARLGLSRRARFLRADMSRLPFPDARFDFVWCCEASEHARGLRALLSEFARVARPGARLAVVAWTVDGADPVTESLRRRIDRAYRTRMHPAQAYRTAGGRLWRLLEDADWTARAAAYWRLRASSRHRTGAEDYMVPAFSSGSIGYHLFTYRREGAQKRGEVPRPQGPAQQSRRRGALPLESRHRR